MTERIAKPMSFFEAVKEIAVFYVHVFKHIFFIVVLAALVQAGVSAFMPENPTIGLAISILASVVAMFFYAWILYHADNIYMNRGETIKDSLKVAKHRFLPLLGVLGIYLLVALVLGLFAYGLQLVGKMLGAQYFFGVIALALVLFVFTLLAFTMPSVIIDETPILKSFERSARLVWGHWWHTFGIILVYIIPVILVSLAILVLPSMNIFTMTLYEFIYHIITYPLMIALVLVLYHDLKARHQMEGFKQVAERHIP
jgi:hypothetical protein